MTVTIQSAQGLFAWLNGRFGITMKAEILPATGMTMMSLRSVATTVAIVVGLLRCSTSVALPPLGLTQLSSHDYRFAKLSVIAGTGYVSTDVGIYRVDASGIQPLLVPAPTGFGPLTGTGLTRVVETASGERIFAASFDSAGVASGGTLALNLSDLLTPIITWQRLDYVIGIDSSLRAIGGNFRFNDDTFTLLADGSAQLIGAEQLFFQPADLTPSGTAIGFGNIPNTTASAPALYNLDGIAEFITLDGAEGGIKDRLDGVGFNYGYSGEYHTVQYGNGLNVNIDESIDRFSVNSDIVIPSESDFTVVQIRGLGNSFDKFAYFPGINPNGFDRSVPLFNLFPELATIDFDYITDISSSEGQIHLLLSGDDGLWLFAARDPSVVPEPSTVCIGAMLVIGFAALRKRRG